MLSKPIIEFIAEMNELKGVGCIIVPQPSIERLVTLLDQADVIIGSVPREGRITYYVLEKEKPLPKMAVPAILIVRSEDYDSDVIFQEKVRNIASYFIRAQ